MKLNPVLVSMCGKAKWDVFLLVGILCEITVRRQTKEYRKLPKLKRVPGNNGKNWPCFLEVAFNNPC